MLVLTRKLREEIVIGDNITVSVNWIRGGIVSLAITAPKDVPVRRGELVRDNAKREERVA